MSVQRIATRYAKSLIDLAVEQGKLDSILGDVQAFGEAVKNRDLFLMLKSPVVSGSKKTQVIEAIFGGHFDELTMAFLNILIKKGRESFLPEITRSFYAQYKKLKHISTVTLTTASEIGEDVVASIHEKLAGSSVTDENIEIITEVDPDLIGGFVIRFDDKIYDASVASKLEEMKKEFRDNLYISQIIAS